MFSKISISRMFSVLIVIVLMSSTASARPLDAPPPLGTGFTYQGRLTDGGAPANGTYDFEFTLYYALSDGSPVGKTVTQDGVPVTNGLFTVLLDFGDVFDGTARYLEIGVRPGASEGAYTPLVPRQPLTATPYAIYASKSPWGGLAGVPAGFADGVDNGSSYQNVKVVAQSGGDFTSIQAALDSITTASTSNRYLVWVAPGVYNEQVTMKQYVDIEGAGEGTTRITFTGSPTETTGTLVGASDAELRFLTVENTGGDACAVAIYNSSAAPSLTHIIASASGGTFNVGVYNNSSSPTMTNVTASASGGTDSNFGVYNNNSSPEMTDVTASASGGWGNFGVYNFSSSPAMTNVTASASGGTSNYGVYNSSSSSPTMTSVTASASGGTIINTGVYNISSSPAMTNVTASASGGTYNYGVHNYFSSSPTINNSLISASGGTNNYGIYNYADGAVRVNNSQVSGDTNTIYNSSGFTTRVGDSHLSGGPVAIAGGTVTCAGVYDENYVFYASTCP